MQDHALTACVLFLGVFVGLGLSGVVPTLHFVISEGLIKATTMGQMGWLLLMATLYITGACLYAARIPERFFPGKCDIWVSRQKTHSSLAPGALSFLLYHHIFSLSFSSLVTLVWCTLSSSLCLSFPLVPLPPAVPHLGGRGGFRSLPRRLQPAGVSLYGGSGLRWGRRPLTHNVPSQHSVFFNRGGTGSYHLDRHSHTHTLPARPQGVCLVCVIHRTSSEGVLIKKNKKRLSRFFLLSPSPPVCPPRPPLPLLTSKSFLRLCRKNIRLLLEGGEALQPPLGHPAFPPCWVVMFKGLKHVIWNRRFTCWMTFFRWVFKYEKKNQIWVNCLLVFLPYLWR